CTMHVNVRRDPRSIDRRLHRRARSSGYRWSSAGRRHAMNRQPLIVLVLIGATALVAGCAAEGQATGRARADAPGVLPAAPTLVALDTSVWVVRDADRAVYYVQEHYWCYRDGDWYRSRSFDGGWKVVDSNVVPETIVTRNHEMYIHYHGEAMAR